MPPRSSIRCRVAVLKVDDGFGHDLPVAAGRFRVRYVPPFSSDMADSISARLDRMGNVPPELLESRGQVWEVLSEFWLDTELQELDFDRIARVLAASPYSLDDINAIHQYEVAPAVSANLASVAGEWAGFDRAWLMQRCHNEALRRHNISRRVRVWLLGPMLWFFTSRYWRRIVPRVQALRNTTLE